MTHRDVPQALALWNAHRGDVGFPYDELGEKAFRSLFIDNGSRTVNVEDGGIMTGFCSAYSKTEYLNGEDYDNTPLYLTITLADDDEAGDMLVEDVVSYARSVGKRSIAATYRNPVMLPWSMSDGSGVYHHNNAPGVPVGSRWQSLLERHGRLSFRPLVCSFFIRCLFLRTGGNDKKKSFPCFCLTDFVKRPFAANSHWTICRQTSR